MAFVTGLYIIMPKFPPGPIIWDPGSIREIVEKTLQIGKKILNVIIGSDEEVEKSKPLDDKSTVDEMIRMNAALTEYREKVAKESKQLEQEIQEVCKGIFEQIIDSVEFANSEFRFYRIETLQRKLNAYLNEIDGVLAKHISHRISLDDMECINILKMLPGELKGQRMIELNKKIFKEALEELCAKMEVFQKDLSEGMEMTVEDRLCDLENTLQERSAKLKTMEEETQSIQEEKEKYRMQAEWKYSVASMFEE